MKIRTTRDLHGAASSYKWKIVSCNPLHPTTVVAAWFGTNKDSCITPMRHLNTSRSTPGSNYTFTNTGHIFGPSFVGTMFGIAVDEEPEYNEYGEIGP